MSKTTVKRNGEPVLERDVEAYWKRQCEKRGWVSEKFTSPSKRSVPDQLITCGGGIAFFCELKRPGKFATRNQQNDHIRRRDLGFIVFVCDSYEQCNEALDIAQEYVRLFGALEPTLPKHLMI